MGFQEVGSHIWHGDVNALQPKLARNPLVVEQAGGLLVAGGKAHTMGTMGSLSKMVLEAIMGSGLWMSNWGWRVSKEAGAYCELDVVREQGQFCD